MRLVPVGGEMKSPAQVAEEIRQRMWLEATTALNQEKERTQVGNGESRITPPAGANRIRISDLLSTRTSPLANSIRISDLIRDEAPETVTIGEALRNVDLEGGE